MRCGGLPSVEQHHAPQHAWHAFPSSPPSHLTLCRGFVGGWGRGGQDDVGAMGSVDSWSCQACKSFRRQMERAAARSQR